MKWLILITGILTNASASILIKFAMTNNFAKPLLTQPLTILKNWPLCLGIIMYGFAFLLYIAALTRLPLNIAHPILTSGAIAIVSIFSVFFLNENFNLNNGLGIVFIIIGVFFLTYK